MTASEYAIGGGRWGSIARARPVPRELWALGAVVAVAVVIRVLTIDNQSFWTDEALTAYEARLPFGAMLNTVLHYETTPPLYFTIAWLWAKAFGTGEVALRSISTIAGVAVVPIAYLAGRDLVSRWAGVLAAAFVAVNPLMVWFSQEARSYMLLAALTGAGFWMFVRSLANPSWRNLAWWTGLSSLALMTHFFAGYAVAPEALWLLWRMRNRLAVAAVAVVVLVQGAMAPFALADTSHGTGWIAQIQLKNRIAGVPLEWGVGTLYRRATFAEGFIGAALLIIVVVVLLWRFGDERAHAGAKLAGAVAGFIFLAPLLAGLIGQDYFLSRNLIPAFVPVVVVLAAACVLRRARIAGAALAVAVLALFSVATARVQTHRFLERPDWRLVARSLGAASAPRAILAAGGTTADPLKIYMPHVNWVMAHGRRVVISEVVVVGALKRFRLAIDRDTQPATREPERSLHLPPRPSRPFGSPVPPRTAPRGARLIARYRVDNWIVARFRLRGPRRISINDLIKLADDYFQRAPRDLLVFFQQPGR